MSQEGRTTAPLRGLIVDLCRLAVRATRRLFSLAAPSGVQSAGLVPVVVRHTGEGLAEAGPDREVDPAAVRRNSRRTFSPY